MTLALVLIAFVFVLFDGLKLLQNPRVNWGWLGMACYFASHLVGAFLTR